MTGPELTRQQLDPVGAISTRAFTISLAIAAFVFGVAMTVHTVDQIVNPLLAVLALVWIGVASLVVVLASSPRKAPFTAQTHTVVHILAVGAFVLSAASQWGANTSIQDDFGAISLGLLIVAMAVYRPAKELAATGVLAAISVGFVTLLETAEMSTVVPPASLVLVGMAPVLALAFGSAAYSKRLVGELEKWQKRAADSVATDTDRLRVGITKSVRQDRVRILNNDAIPFFAEILRRDNITKDDRLHARQIAESIRVLMVAEADRTWLELVAREDGIPPDHMHDSVLDPQGLATAMVTSQRATLRAFIVVLREDELFVPTSMKVTIFEENSIIRGVLVARMEDHAPDPQMTFAVYFAVMRVTFTDVSTEYDNSQLTVRFSYEQR